MTGLNVAATNDPHPVTYEAGWDSTAGVQAVLLNAIVYAWWLFIGGTFEILFGGMYLGSTQQAQIHVSSPWASLFYVVVGVVMVILGFGILRLERWVYWAAWPFTLAYTAVSIIEIVRWVQGTPIVAETVFFAGLNLLFALYNVYLLTQADTRKSLRFGIFKGSPMSPGMAVCGIALAVLPERLRGAQPARQHERVVSLVTAEVRVPRRHRQSVGLAHDRAADDADVGVTLARHRLDHAQLLEVLLPEIRRVRLHDVEETRDDGRDPDEMAGSRGALERRGDRTGIDARRVAGRIDLLDRRDEDGIGARPQQRAVLFLITRVRAEVLVRKELRGIHEDRGDGRVVLAAGPVDEREMALVECAHRRDEAHALHRAAPGAHVRDGAQWIHRGCVA